MCQSHRKKEPFPYLGLLRISQRSFYRADASAVAGSFIQPDGYRHTAPVLKRSPELSTSELLYCIDCLLIPVVINWTELFVGG